MDISQLDVESNAYAAAQMLQNRFPNIKFTGGRRNVSEQANAMASNIVRSGNGKWIQQTYKDSAPIRELQEWVDEYWNDNGTAPSVTDIAEGLESVYE